MEHIQFWWIGMNSCQFSAQELVVKYKEQLSNISNTKGLLAIVTEFRPLSDWSRQEVSLKIGMMRFIGDVGQILKSWQVSFDLFRDKSRVWYTDDG